VPHTKENTMFANTLTVTVNAVAKVLTRVNQDNYGSVYVLKETDGEWKLQFRNSTEKGAVGVQDIDRHNMFLERTIYATPTVAEKYFSFTSTLRVRKSFDLTVASQIVAGAITLLTAQTSGMIAGES
jgi:hypothetical protein